MPVWGFLAHLARETGAFKSYLISEVYMKVEPNPKAYTRKLKHPKEDDPEETEDMRQ